ncbi:MAG: polymer-forming cytoskeletal protein [Bacillota bacterium]
MSVSFGPNASRSTSRCAVRTCSRSISRSIARRPVRLGLAILVTMVAVAATRAMFCGLAEPAYAEGRRSGGSFVVGGAIHVAADETVEGGVVSLGGKVTVDGHVSGGAVSIGGPVEVNGTVDGDVVSVGSQVSLGENARVTGDVTSVGGTVYRAEGAVVHGDVTSVGFPSFRFNMRDLRWHRMPWAFWHMPWGFWGAMWIVRLVGVLVLSLIIVAIWPNHTASVAAAVETRLGRVAAIGLVAWLLFVPAMILLAITLIGIPLIPIWVLLYVAAGALGHAAIAVLVGDRVARLANAQMTMLAKVIVGALVLALLGWIPGVGIIVAIAVAVIGLGAVLETRFGTNRPWFPQRQPTPPETPPQQ